jgi:hypothetical protein
MSTGSRKSALAVGAAAFVTLAIALAALATRPEDPTAAERDPLTGAPTTAASVDGAPALRIVAAPAASEPVAPPAGSPLATVRRDCGSSEPLPGGGRIWLYCDTTMFEPGGRLRWFVNTSGAVATDDEPLVMLEATDPDGRVVPMLEPRPTYPRCEAGEGRFTWPTAGVRVAAGAEHDEDGDGEALAIFYENVCVVPRDFVGNDSGLAVIDPPTVPPEQLAADPLEATIVEDRLFERPEDARPFGQAALRVDDVVYAYRCPRSDRPCSVARAPARLEDLADVTAWEVWDGQGWAPHGEDGAAAQPMEMPGAAFGFKPSVAWLEDLGVFVLVDHLVFAPSVLHVRVADEPWGPWSEPQRVDLPGCQADWPDVCFAVEVHEHLSGPGRIGITWFDPTYPPGEADPLRHGTVEVAVVRGEP